MSEAVTVRDFATPMLDRVRRQVDRPRLLLQACGRRVENILHGHFLKRNAEPNRQGWAKSNWWAREVKGNTSLTSATDTEAVVSIASLQFLHRLLGGKVQGHPYLALPLTEEAKIKGSPREWSSPGDGQLQFIRSKLGSCYLFPDEGQSHGASYLLVRSVTQKADPDALPEQGEIEAGVDDEAVKFFERIKQ